LNNFLISKSENWEETFVWDEKNLYFKRLVNCWKGVLKMLRIFREGPSCWLDIGQAVTGGGHVVYLNLNSRPCGPRF